jgi:hypothetical protein
LHNSQKYKELGELPVTTGPLIRSHVTSSMISGLPVAVTTSEDSGDTGSVGEDQGNGGNGGDGDFEGLEGLGGLDIPIP